MAEGLLRMHVNPTRKAWLHSVSLPRAFSLHFQHWSSNRNSSFGSGTFHILGFSSTINGKLAYNRVTYRQADIHKTNTGAHLRAAQNMKRDHSALLSQDFLLGEKLGWPSKAISSKYYVACQSCHSFVITHTKIILHVFNVWLFFVVAIIQLESSLFSQV